MYPKLPKNVLLSVKAVVNPYPEDGIIRDSLAVIRVHIKLR